MTFLCYLQKLLEHVEKMLKRILELLINMKKIGFSNALKVKFQKADMVRLNNIKHPIHLRPKTSDTTIFRHIFIEEQYKVHLNFTPSFIIDAGANIGLASVYFKNIYPAATIVAIEPEADNYAMFQKNLKNYTQIYSEKCGLWHRNAFTTVTDKYNMGKWGMVIEECEEDGSENVSATITVNDILKKYKVDRIDVFKIDIETAEKALFSENYETWLPKTKVVIIELHDRLMKGCAQSFFNAIHLSFKNYSYFQVGENTVIVNEDI